MDLDKIEKRLNLLEENVEKRLSLLEDSIKALNDKLDSYIESKRCRHFYNPGNPRSEYKYSCGKCDHKTNDPTGYSIYRGD